MTFSEADPIRRIEELERRQRVPDLYPETDMFGNSIAPGEWLALDVDTKTCPCGGCRERRGEIRRDTGVWSWCLGCGQPRPNGFNAQCGQCAVWGTTSCDEIAARTQSIYRRRTRGGAPA